MGEAVRPGDYSGSDALGGKDAACVGEPKLTRPFIVDLDADARVDLEAAMKKGVVVVAYDCASLRVLPNCKVPDVGYEYVGTSRKEQLVQMKSSDELRANMPISAAKLSTEVESGRTIDLGLVLVGRNSTTLAQLERADLGGSCDGATHYVQSATLGAFSMATGSVGKAAVVAEMFGAGAGAKSESERKSMNTDGSLEACRASDPDATAPPAECRAPLRIELAPIQQKIAAVGKQSDEQKKAAAAAESPCEPGFQWVDGICSAAAGGAYLCDPKNAAECESQCQKGSAGSCFNFARTSGVKRYSPAWKDLMKKSCDGGYADGCAEFAYRELPDTDLPNAAELTRAPLAMLAKSCADGSALGCERVGDVLTDETYGHHDVQKAVRAYDRGCTLGRGMACWSAALVYFKGEGLPQNTERGLSYLVKSCKAGSADECDDLSNVRATGKYGARVDVDGAVRAGRDACRLDHELCELAAKRVEKLGRNAEAFEFANRGCAGGDYASCAALGRYYDNGLGTTPDPAKAREAHMKGCENGDGDAGSCRKVGITPND